MRHRLPPALRLRDFGLLWISSLANGLALENRIRPIFIGHGFGNYDDRLRRDEPHLQALPDQAFVEIRLVWERGKGRYQ